MEIIAAFQYDSFFVIVNQHTNEKKQMEIMTDKTYLQFG